MGADDLVHVLIFEKLWMWNLTPPLVTNEQSYLREEPIQGHSSLENPEEQEHWVLTRRANRPPTKRTIDEKVARSGVTLLRISPILGAYNRRPVRGRHFASPIEILRIVL